MPKDKFSLSVVLNSQPTGGRNKVTANVVIKDGGKDFFEQTNVWHDMADVGVDVIEDLLEDAMGEPSPINLQNLTEANILMLEQKLNHAINTLNLAGQSMIGQDSDNKQRAAQAYLQKKGKKPKKRR